MAFGFPAKSKNRGKQSKLRRESTKALNRNDNVFYLQHPHNTFIRPPPTIVSPSSVGGEGAKSMTLAYQLKTVCYQVRIILSSRESSFLLSLDSLGSVVPFSCFRISLSLSLSHPSTAIIIPCFSSRYRDIRGRYSSRTRTVPVHCSQPPTPFCSGA